MARVAQANRRMIMQHMRQRMQHLGLKATHASNLYSGYSQVGEANHVSRHACAAVACRCCQLLLSRCLRSSWQSRQS